jgi:hypothetical protein
MLAPFGGAIGSDFAPATAGVSLSPSPEGPWQLAHLSRYTLSPAAICAARAAAPPALDVAGVALVVDGACGGSGAAPPQATVATETNSDPVKAIAA